MSKLVYVTGLFQKESQSGKYLSGKTDKDIPAGTVVQVYKNDRKQSDNQPDYQLKMVTDDDGPAPAAGGGEEDLF